MRLSLLTSKNFTSDPQNAKSVLWNWYIDKAQGTKDEVSTLPFIHGTSLSGSLGSGGARGGVDSFVVIGSAVYGATSGSLSTSSGRTILASGGAISIISRGGTGSGRTLDIVGAPSTSGSVVLPSLSTDYSLEVGDYITITAVAGGADVDFIGTWKITSISGDTLYFTTTGTLSTTGTGTLTFNGKSDGTQVLITDGSYAYVLAGSALTSNTVLYNLWKLDGTILESGSATSTSTLHLVDTTALFITNGVKAGMTVYNSTTDTYLKILNVYSETILRLAVSGFTSGDTYTINQGYGIDFLSPKSCTFLDGYHIVDSQRSGTRGRFYISSLYDANVWNALDYAEAEHSGDALTRVASRNNELWLIGARSTEVWYNSGNPDFPFSPLENTVFSYGITYHDTVQLIEDELMWLSDKGTIVRTKGLQLEELTAPSSEPATGTFALSLFYNGHTFYILNNSHSNNGTNVYDVSTGVWFNWGYKSSNGNWNNYPVGYLYSTTLYNRDTPYSSTYSVNSSDAFSGGVTTTTRELISSPIVNPDNYKKFFYKNVDIICSNKTVLEITSTTTDAISAIPEIPLSGIQSGVDYILRINDGVTDTFDIAPPFTTNMQVFSHPFSTGDLITIWDVSAGGILNSLATTISLRWIDENFRKSGTYSRSASYENSRVCFRNLGSSRDRTFIISNVGTVGTSLFACALDIEEMDS